MSKRRDVALQVESLSSQNDPRSNLAPAPPFTNCAIWIATSCHLPSEKPFAYRSTITLALSLWVALAANPTLREPGSGASSGDLASTRIWNVRWLYGVRSNPAFAGNQPNTFQ